MNSPKDLIESQFPNYFLEQYPQFVTFIEEYYNFLESSIAIFTDKKSCKVGDVLYGSLSKAKAIVKIIADDKVYFDYETETNNFYKNEVVLNGTTGQTYFIKSLYKNIYSYVRDIEENTAYDTVQNIFKKYFKRNISLDHSIFTRLDPNTLTKKILEYYKNRGTENSYYWFFRIFFDDIIDLYYPKVDILRLSDTYHIEKRWMQIDYKGEINRFEKTRIIGKTSKATATVRRVETKSIDNQRRAFLDLIYINGEFLEYEEITGHDIITGEKLVTGKVLPSITGLRVDDGGIGHKVGDEFTYKDGIGEVSHLKEYSVTNITINDPGLFYAVGDYVNFENEYTGATAFANAQVAEIETNKLFSDYAYYLNSTLKYRQSSPYLGSNLGNAVTSNSNTFSNTNLLYKVPTPYIELGPIKSLKINKSGLDYKFAPPAKVVSSNFQADNLYYFDLVLYRSDANSYLLAANTIVNINGDPALYIGVKTIEYNVYFEEIDVLTEDFYVDRFLAPRTLYDDFLEKNIVDTNPTSEYSIYNLYDLPYSGSYPFRFLSPASEYPATFILYKPNGSFDTFEDAANSTHLDQNVIRLGVDGLFAYDTLNNSSDISTHLGYGVEKIKLTNAGLLVDDEDNICFRTGPYNRNYDPEEILNPLDTTLGYKHGVIFDPIEEFIENNSNLSSNKHIEDNFYYQSFSYQITTRVPAEIIEPLLLDELHPAGFIAFIRNKIDEEVSLRIKAYEFPRIEYETEIGPFNNEIAPYIVQMQEQFIDMSYGDLYDNLTFDNTDNGDIYFDNSDIQFDLISKEIVKSEYVLVNEQMTDTELRDHVVETELESNDIIDVFEGFRLYVEDCLIRPESKSFTEFRKCDAGPFFDSAEDVYFDDIGSGTEPDLFDSDGTCIPTGYGTSKEYSRLEKEIFYDYSNYSAFESFYKIISVEDESNWRADPIGRYKGSIYSRYDFEITNHKAVIEEIINLTTTRNLGGKIVVRDLLGTTSKYKFDDEYTYFDATMLFDKTLNFSGEAFNYTPNPLFFFDSTDANNLIYDFSSNNTINLICNFPNHLHNNLNFSNEPITAYEPIVSGNTLESRGSYLPTAEILTKGGNFIQIQNLKMGDEIAYVKDDGKVEWRRAKEIIKQKYNGVMYRYSDYNRISITVTPNQDLVVYNTGGFDEKYLGGKKVKAKRLNLTKSNQAFGLVDINKAGTYESALKDYLPIHQRMHRDNIQYDGYVYCLVFEELTEAIPMQPVINNVDLDVLKLYSTINNDHTLPKFDPIHIVRANHSRFDDNITVNIKTEDFTLYLPTSNSILFDFNTNKEDGVYVSFKPEIGLTNATKISTLDGPTFDDATHPTFDSEKRHTFDSTGQRFQVNMERMYVGSNHVLTKIPKGHEQRVQYTKELDFDYFEFIDGNLQKDEFGNTANAELYLYESLKIEPSEIKFKPVDKLITETDFMLYPKLFGPEVTFDLAMLSPPGCLNGSFDYFSSNNISAYKFDSNTGQLGFDYDRDQCVTKLAEKPLDRYITFDTARRTFDQTNDFYVKTHQYVQPEQILTNSADQDIVQNKQNDAGIKFGESEVVRIGETFGKAVVATIKNYRVDLKKKFFDSIIWSFDRDYNYTNLNPLEHSGFDSVETPAQLDLDCFHLFIDNDSFTFDRTTIGYYTRDNSPKTFAETGIDFADIGFRFDRYGVVYKDCSLREVPFPYDLEEKNIAIKLINDITIDGYGPYGISKSFDSAEPGHGFDKSNYPFFDNDEGNIKPLVKPEVVIINVDEQNVSVSGGKNDPLQTLILVAEDAYKYETKGLAEQLLINWAQIVICKQPGIYYEDVIRDFEYEIIRPYLQDDACDPSSTKGTSAYYEPILINHPHEYMPTEVSEHETVIWKNEPSYFDATFSFVVENEMELTSDILSCNPIRYTDYIYEFRRYKISPYLYDTCPGDDRILRTETNFEYTLVNEDTYYANTQYIENHEIEIYSHFDNSLYPDKAHLLAANNTSIFTYELPEIEVANHIGSRNCAIALTEILYNHLDTKITDCHLEEKLRDWIKDTIPTTKVSASTVLYLGANSVYSNTEFGQNQIIYNAPSFVDGTMALSDYDVEQKIPIDILDRNPYLWTGQLIAAKLHEFITEASNKHKISDYVKDKIPSVRISQMTHITHPRSVSANSISNLSNTGPVFSRELPSIDATFNYENQFENEYHVFLEDRNLYINVDDGLFTTRLNESITDYLLSRKLIDYDGDKIPSVKATPQTEIERETSTERNDIQELFESQLIRYSEDTLYIDGTIAMSEFSELDQHRFIPDRNVVISLDKKFNLLTLDKVIEPKHSWRPILAYSGDHIPSVTVDVRPSFKQYRTAFFDFSANTTSDSIVSGEDNYLFVDATTEYEEFNEIEDDKVLISDHMFISPDDIIGTYYEYYLDKPDKLLLRQDRFDTSRTILVKERHELEMDNLIKPNPYYQIGTFGDAKGLSFDSNVHKFEEIKERKDIAHYEISYGQDTILYNDEPTYLESTNEYEEFNEIEYDKTICDLHSIIPLNEKVKGTVWEYYPILEKELRFKIRENGLGCIETVRVDPRPSIEVERTEYHDLQSSTFLDTIVSGESNYLFVDATTEYEEFNEIESDQKICDLFSVIPLNEKVKGTIWEYRYLLDKDLKNPIKEDSRSCIQTVTVDSRPSIEYFRAFEHNLERSLEQHFTLEFEDSFIDITGASQEFDEIEQEIKIPDRFDYFGLDYSINKLFGQKIIDMYNFIDRKLVDYNRFAIPTVRVDMEPEVTPSKTLYHDLPSNTFMDFVVSDFNQHIDNTFDYGQFNELEYQKEILSIEPYFDLNQNIESFMFNEDLYDKYGLLKADHVLTPKLLNKVLSDYLKDKHQFNVITEEPHIERIYLEHAYGPYDKTLETPDYLPNKFKEDFLNEELIISYGDQLFVDSTFSVDRVEEIEKEVIIWNDRQAFSIADIIEDEKLFEKLDKNKGKRLIDDFSIHNAVITTEVPKIINRPHEYANTALKGQETIINTIVSADHFEKFIDSTIILNDYTESSVNMLIHNLFEDLSYEARETEATLINRPTAFANTAINGQKSFTDTIITGSHFEKFIDSSIVNQEIFTNLEITPTANNILTANDTLVENKLINMTDGYVGNDAHIETYLKGGYYEKFIDSTSKICSELYQYNHAKRANVALKDVSTIPWFSSNLANNGTATTGWFFSTNSFASNTNTMITFSTAGPDYQVQFEPSYIEMALATQNAYSIPIANNGYLTANGWQYFDQQEPLPIPLANTGYQSNRTLEISVFEKIEFVIEDIANNHNNCFFAVGTSPWFDNNREANALFGIANGVTYELDGNVYSNFTDYKNDFVSGTKKNAKITFAPTISLAMLRGSDANTVNGANSGNCHVGYNPLIANTYTFYYWSNANNTVYSAGGEIKIYELNNLEECLNYSINKTSYLDNIRSEKEFICA